ncbi:MAG: glutamate decarboxylase [Actinomycetota bacterium]|nr:glutamate decarboxylase [Actinomycetota bacterium]
MLTWVETPTMRQNQPMPRISRPSDPQPTVATVNPCLTDEELIRVPTDRIPARGIPSDAAYQLVHDEAMLDGNARLNLATFVGTWMDDQANRLYAESYDKNMIDKDEYPATAEIEQRCGQMLATLWNAPDKTVAVSTVGSSEACMMAGLAFKKRWQAARRAAGKSTDKPNLVMSSAVQVVWERFCVYWDVEARYVPITLESPTLTAESMLPHVDENTIGVVGILGVTYTGGYEPIADLAAALDTLHAKTGLDVPLHVDGASGGMVAPFLQPDLQWDFRNERVHSINTSGHKYGLVYPGLGWVAWRKKEYLPEEMVFDVAYLGGDMPSLGINFSRPGAQVLLQYYLFLRLGESGYRLVHGESQRVAMYLSSAIGEMAEFTLLSDGSDIPVFAWRLADDFTGEWTLPTLSDRLHYYGWQVPAYPMPAAITNVEVMRIVVRAGMSEDLADKLLADLRTCIAELNQDAPKARAKSAFHH